MDVSYSQASKTGALKTGLLLVQFFDNKSKKKLCLKHNKIGSV
jgi:hypothetical protein